MSWRAYYLGVVVLGCLGSIVTLSASNECLGWAVPLLLALSGGLYWVGGLTYRYSWYRYHNFKISVINRLPLSQYTQPFIEEPWSVKALPIKEHKLCVKVRSRCGFPVKSMNWRF